MKPVPGQSHWFDLPVVDLADAMSFYEGLLGWTYQQMDPSPLDGYVMIESGGELIGGLRRVERLLPESTGPILYFTVEHLTASVTRAKELGAKIVGDAVPLGPGRGRYQWIRDREGTLIGLWAKE